MLLMMEEKKDMNPRLNLPTYTILDLQLHDPNDGVALLKCVVPANLERKGT